MSVCLIALPPELLSHIVANIPSPSTLCNLARCSRYLHLWTMPHLYRHVTIHEKTPRPEWGDGRLRTLAALLIQRPDLASLVRHFTLRIAERSRQKEECSGELREPTDSDDGVNPDMVKIDPAFVTAANVSSLSQEKKISCLGQFSPTHQSHYDFILALLLPALLKLEKLELDWDNLHDTYYLQQVMARAARREKPFDTQPPFEALTVFIHSHYRFHVTSTGFIASLLKLPIIQKISVRFDKLWDDEDDNIRDDDNTGDKDDIPWDEDLKDVDSSSSPLWYLDLSVRGLNIADLGHILRAPKALKTLSYKICQPAYVNFKDIRHALGPQENCLESIDLDCDPDNEMDFDLYRSMCQTMTSFTSFNALKVFKTQAVSLAVIDNVKGSETHSLIDIFPRSLETLHLTLFNAGYGSLVQALENLLIRKSPRQIPSLKKLILDETDQIRAAMYGARTVKLKDGLWEGVQETAMRRLGRVAAAKEVSIDVVERLTDNKSLFIGE